MNGSRIRTIATAAVTLTLAFACLALARPAQAGLEGVGGSIGYANPEDLDGTAALGLHAEVATPGSRVAMMPNMRFWDVDGYRDVAPNLDVAYRFQHERGWSPYLGGGLGVNFVHDDHRDRTDTDLGLNMIGGLRFPGDRNHYFLEGRFTASDVSQVSIQTGVTFHAP